MTTNELTVPEVGKDLSVQGLTEQVSIIKKAMQAVMVEDTHYGRIPGCGDKPALLQPGAHKLGLMFNLAPEYEIDIVKHDDGHREYEVICRLTHRDTGRFIGQGVGNASTMESRYRYRWDDTGAEVPKDYWKTRDKEMLGGPQFVPRKTWVNNQQRWHIFQRVEHDNPADYWNTCKKIAKKRAYNDAILTATAASDIFVPDDAVEETFIHPDEPPAATQANDSGEETIPFGKYKGKPWSAADNGWLHWCESKAGSDVMRKKAREEIDRRKQPEGDIRQEEPEMADEAAIRGMRNALKEAEIGVEEALEILKIPSLGDLRKDQVAAFHEWVKDPGTLPEALRS